MTARRSAGSLQTLLFFTSVLHTARTAARIVDLPPTRPLRPGTDEMTAATYTGSIGAARSLPQWTDPGKKERARCRLPAVLCARGGPLSTPRDSILASCEQNRMDETKTSVCRRCNHRDCLNRCVSTKPSASSPAPRAVLVSVHCETHRTPRTCCSCVAALLPNTCVASHSTTDSAELQPY